MRINLKKNLNVIANVGLFTYIRYDDPTKSFKMPALVSECITSPCYYLVLLAVEGYSLLSRPGFHRFLVGVVLTDVDVSLALELANLIEKTTQVL